MAIGSVFSNLLHDVSGWVAGDGNEAGNPQTRSLGYDPAIVAQATVATLNQPAPPTVQTELLLMGLAGVGLILLLHPKKRRY